MYLLNYFQNFKEDISEIPLPEKFTFPFYYEPHHLAKIAAKELQKYLKTQSDFIHDFGLNKKSENLKIISTSFYILKVHYKS